MEKNLEYRQKYAPPVLIELRNELESMTPVIEVLPKTGLAEAARYALHEFSSVCDIFKRGDTSLDNNAIERCLDKPGDGYSLVIVSDSNYH